jgi:hypothetical protein
MMKRKWISFYHIGLLFFFVSILVSVYSGCSTITQQKAVVALPNRETASLDSDDIIKIMQRAGFDDKQIIDFGTDLRNSLALQGSAQVQVQGKILAVFAVHGSYVHIISRITGNSIYDFESHELK